MTTRLAPRVRRALLYLQGYDGKKILKAATHPTLDCACLDMEDGVGVTMKDAARQGIVYALQHEKQNFGRTEVLARINAFNHDDPTDTTAYQDLDALLLQPSFATTILPDGIVIPKVTTPQDILTVSERLDVMSGDDAAMVRIIGMIESATAVVNLPAILAAAPHRFDAVIFGGDDYAASVGATRTATNHELLTARQLVLLHAAAVGVSCVDIVHIDFHDEAALRVEAKESFEMGYTGKQVIHPKQIIPVQEEYSPDAAAVAHAAAVVQANREHQAAGQGAFSFDGKMIDRPTVKQYESLLHRAHLMGLYDMPI